MDETEKLFYNISVLEKASKDLLKNNNIKYNIIYFPKSLKDKNDDCKIQFAKDINDLRKSIFNFKYIYMFGDYIYGDNDFILGQEIYTYDTEKIYAEKYSNFIRFDEYIKTCSFEQFFIYYIQILMAFDFSPNISFKKLKASDIDIRNVYSSKFQLKYKKYIITDGSIATLNNYLYLDNNCNILDAIYLLLDDCFNILKEYNKIVYKEIKKLEKKETLEEFIEYCINFSEIKVSNKPYTLKLLSPKNYISYENIEIEFNKIQLFEFSIIYIRIENLINDFEFIKCNYNNVIEFMNNYEKLKWCLKNLKDDNFKTYILKMKIFNIIEKFEEFKNILIKVILHNFELINKEFKMLELNDIQYNFYKNYKKII